MKKACIIFFLGLSIFAYGQVWSGQIVGNNLIITDDYPIINYPSMTVKWEYTLIGDCTTWRTGKLDPAKEYEIQIPAHLIDGFLLQKTLWFGHITAVGLTKWTSQTSTCMDLVMPDCVPTTPQLPTQINLSIYNWKPQWASVDVSGADVNTTIDLPPGFILQEEWIFTLSGIPVNKTNLPAGQYFVFWLYEGTGSFDGLHLAQEESFTIF